VTGWPTGLRGPCWGGDYNPEQWPEHVWTQDVELMKRSGVNLVSVGIFAWARLEVADNRFDFGWLDQVLDQLHEGGIRVCLANATASPPPWLTAANPDMLPVRADGVRLSHGSRQEYCPTSPVYRDRAIALTEKIALRYGEHPALAAWHVNNEYGCHVSRCYCDRCAEVFRDWLRARYDLDGLNRAWGTDFWSQHYSAWEQVLPPRVTPTYQNPSQVLDFARFCSDALLDLFCAERDVLSDVTPDVPVTTNFMVGWTFKALNYWHWAAEVDFVANDHYTRAADPERHVELALSADLVRGLSRGAPWLLMEHSTSAVNWQPRNFAKLGGELRRNSFSHLARGADGTLFFQWRQSAAGAERFHSAMLPHGGTLTRKWQEVAQLTVQFDVVQNLVRRDSTRAALVTQMFGLEYMARTLQRAYRAAADTQRESIRSQIEKVIAGHSEAVMRLRTLDPGTYPFIGDRLIIGRFCAIAEGARFIMNGANHAMSGFSTYPFNIFGHGWEHGFDPKTWSQEVRGDTVLGNDVWIAMDAVIMPGVTVGHGAIVAAKSVVTHDVPAYAIVAGNAAKVVKMRFDDRTVRRLLAVAWWNWPVDKIGRNLNAIRGADISGLEAAV